MRELCGNPLPTFSDGGYSAAHEAMTSAYWVWQRDLVADRWLYVDQSQCYTGSQGGAWFELCGGDSNNESWYETSAVIQSLCGGGASVLGCTARQQCNANSGDTLREADTLISSDAGGSGYSVVNQNSLSECFDSGVNMEINWIHEIGHAYGLGHDDSLPSYMGTNPPFGPNCDLHDSADLYSPYPMPDEMWGKNVLNGNIPSGAHNLSASHWNWNSMGGWTLQPGVNSDQVTASGQAIYYVTGDPWDAVVFDDLDHLIHSYFPNSVTLKWKYVLISVSGPEPQYDPFTKTWSYAAEWASLTINDSFAAAESRSVPMSQVIFGSELAVGVYRVYIHVDPNNEVGERHEGDNMVPMWILVVRS